MPQVDRFRFKNENWMLNQSETDRNSLATINDAMLAVLMDLRDELKALRRIFECVKFQAVPHRLERIAKAVERKPSRNHASS